MNFEKRKRIVIKIGTTSLTNEKGKINLLLIKNLSTILTDLRNSGIEIVLVSSGAISVGADRLGIKRPRDILYKQAASSVGQGILMQIYEDFFMRYNQKVAQILLTKIVFRDERMRINTMNTLTTLLSLEVIPIINENDTISVDELGFSDNDSLSAYVSDLINADMLIILSDIDGLYDKDPKINADARLIPIVETITPEILALAGDTNSKFGTGGMNTKILAAKMVGENGTDTVIVSGKDPSIIYDVLLGDFQGTLIKGKDKRKK